jgi:hypothetical protein
MPDSGPNTPTILGYQPERSFESERRRRRWGRLLKRIGLAVACIVGAIVLLIGIDVVYELCRHHTTEQEVQGWMATLGPNATATDVERLFDSHRMRWVRTGPRLGLPPWAPDVVSPAGYGRQGVLDDVEEGFMVEKDIGVMVYFENDDHIKSIKVEARWFGP